MEARHRFGGLFQGPSGGSEEVTIVAVRRDDTTRAPGHRRLFTLFLASLLTAAAMLALVVAPARAATRRPAESPITEANGVALAEPFGIAVDGGDHLWVSEAETGGTVDRYGPTRAYETQTVSPPWAPSRFVQSLAFSAQASEVFAADSNLDDLWGLEVATAAYSEKDLFGPPFDTGPHVGSGFLRVAVDNSGGAQAGYIYVLNRNQGTVSRIKADGSEAPFSATGTAQLTGPFEEPRSITVGPGGNLLVGGKENNATGAVYEFEPSGELIRTITSAGGASIEPTIEALTLDPVSGNLLIAEGGSQPTILEISPAGTLEARITAYSGANLGAIAGLAVDSTGRLYASEPGAHRVDVLGPAEPLPIESDGGSITEVTDSAAKLRARIDPNGHPTTYQFQYGLSDCVVPGACTSVPEPPVSVGPGEAILEVSQRVTGLAPGTTYHYRLLVEDTSTEVLVAGPDRTFTTQPSSAPLTLPDGRQWELVSPPDKGSGEPSAGEEFGFTQAAVRGGAIAYMTLAPFGAAAEGGGPGIQVLSSRGAAGWTSHDLGVPQRVSSGAGVTLPPQMRFFTSELTTGVLEPYGPFEPSFSPEATEQTPYLRTLGSCNRDCLRPLVTAANVPPKTEFGAESACLEHVSGLCGPEFQGASSDASHIILKSVVSLTSGAPTGKIEANESHAPGELYEWSEGQLQLVSVLPPDGAGTELAAPLTGGEPALGAAFGILAGAVEGAISSNGSRVFFTYKGNLYLRDTELGRSIELDSAEPGCAAGVCESGGGRFQFANAGGSRVFFTDTNRLTADSGAGTDEGSGQKSADLYECRIGAAAGQPTCALSDLTPAVAGESARVQGDVLGVAADGSAIYFVADAVLPGTGAEPGTCIGGVPSPAAHCNLYVLRDNAAPRLVASLTGADSFDWAENPLNRPTRVSPNGLWVAFLSQEPLTGYDNRDVASDQPDAEAFLYGALSGRLTCVSCTPSEARPTGVKFESLESGASVALPFFKEWDPRLWVAALLPSRYQLRAREPGRQARYLSNSGRLYFHALDALVPADTNGVGDVYQYEPAGVGTCSVSIPTYHLSEGGCVDLISSGTSPVPSQFIDASESGDDVFFLTSSRLTGADVDDQRDVYDAHVCGAEGVSCAPETTPPASPCLGEACQAPAASQLKATPQTAGTPGSGNVVQCRKTQVKQKGKCIKKQQKKSKKHKKKGNKHAKKRANVNRGGHK